MLKQRMRRDLHLLNKVLQNRGTIERWYNSTAVKFMQSREFKDDEEALLEEVTDFFLDNLSNSEYNRDMIYEKLNENENE